MDSPEPFLLFTSKFNELDLRYMVSGSVAAIYYGEPRMTNDVDIIVFLRREDARKLPAAFPEDEYYCPPLEVIDSERTRDQRGHFNLIHHETGFKADIYLVGSDELHRGGNSAAFFIPASSPPRGSLSQSHAPIVCGLELPTDADQGRGGEGSSRAHRSRSGDVRPHGIPARQCCRGWFHL